MTAVRPAVAGRRADGTSRRPPRFPAMPRRRYNALLASSAALLAAALIGVQLGHSAIAEINPIHFQGAAEPPLAIDPGALRPPAPDGFASAYGWDQGYAARAYECAGNCDAREIRQAAAVAMEPIGGQGAGAPAWRDATPVAEPKPWPPGETATAALSVERYLHYPVEQVSAEEPFEQRLAAEVSDDEAKPADDE